MRTKQKAIAFGDYTDPDWHQFTAIDAELGTILAEEVELTCTEDYGGLARDELAAYDLIITYADRWKAKSTPELVDAVLAFVAGGGGMLCLHNGIIVSDYELTQMYGGIFTMHPPYETLQFRVPATEHPILEGISDFAMGEEPYQFDLDPFTERTALLEYEYEGRRWPAAWAHRFAKGRVVYLAPGHNVESFQHPMFRRLIANGARWAMGAGDSEEL